MLKNDLKQTSYIYLYIYIYIYIHTPTHKQNVDVEKDVKPIVGYDKHK